MKGSDYDLYDALRFEAALVNHAWMITGAIGVLLIILSVALSSYVLMIVGGSITVVFLINDDLELQHRHNMHHRTPLKFSDKEDKR